MPTKLHELPEDVRAAVTVLRARSQRASAPPTHSAGEAPVQRKRSPPRDTARPAAQRQPDVPGPEWELVLRIADSRGFVRSPLLTNFLLFVARRTLTGDAATVNEQQIGVHVFRRKEQFNRSDDNIVRNYARMLRKRIDGYFLHEGVDEVLRVYIPRGGYVPVFGPRTAEVLDLPKAPPADQPETLTAISPAAPEVETIDRRTGSLGLVSLAALVLLIGLLGGAVIARVAASGEWHRKSEADRLTHRFWQTLFAGDRDTLIVPSDGGLVILHRFLERPTTLSEYISGAYRSADTVEQGLRTLTRTTSPAKIPVLVRKVETLGDRRYTSIVDLDLASRISRRSEVLPDRLLIRYARDLRIDDLKNSNAILIGSSDANPWVELFQSQANFQFTYGAAFGGSATIVNRQPRAGEALSYASVTGDQAQKTFGVIAYVPNLGGTGHVLMVEGINMAGTQAAAEFLFNPLLMRKVLERTVKVNGEVAPFEILIETSSVAANSSEPKVVSERVGGK